MNIALICGQNSVVIKTKLPNIGDTVDTYGTVSEMVSAQKPYFYDRLVITSQVFTNKSRNEINQEAGLLNKFNKEHPNSILVFAMNANESSLLNAFSKAFSSTNCTVLAMNSMSVPDVISLMQKPLVEINSTYHSVKPEVSVRQRQVPEQAPQPQAEKKEKHGLFGFSRGKKGETEQQPEALQQEPAPVKPKEKKGLFGFGKKHKNEQNSQNSVLQNQQDISQQTGGYNQVNSNTPNDDFFNEQTYSQPNEVVDLNGNATPVESNVNANPQEFVDINSNNAIYTGSNNSPVNNQNNQASSMEFTPNQSMVQPDMPPVENNVIEESVSQVNLQAGVNITNNEPVQPQAEPSVVAPVNDFTAPQSAEVNSNISQDAGVAGTPVNNSQPRMVTQQPFVNPVNPTEVNKDNSNLSTVPPANINVPFTSAPSPTADLHTVGKSDIFNISELESAYNKTQEVKVVEKVVEKKVVVNGNDIVSNIISGASKRIILITGDRGSGITTTALEIAKFFFKHDVKTLYVDGDLATHGVLNYLNYENLVKYGNIKMQGTKLCNSINAFDNCVIKLPEFDLLTSNYCTEICDEEFVLTQSVVAEKADDYGVVVVDIPLQYLHLCEDLMTGTPIVCVEASVRGYMNLLYYLDGSKLSNRYKRVVQNKGTMLLTGVRPSSNIAKLQGYIKSIVSSDVNWMSMPSLQRQGNVNKEFLNQILSI